MAGLREFYLAVGRILHFSDLPFFTELLQWYELHRWYFGLYVHSVWDVLCRNIYLSEGWIWHHVHSHPPFFCPSSFWAVSMYSALFSSSSFAFSAGGYLLPVYVYQWVFYIPGEHYGSLGYGVFLSMENVMLSASYTFTFRLFHLLFFIQWCRYNTSRYRWCWCRTYLSAAICRNFLAPIVCYQIYG